MSYKLEGLGYDSWWCHWNFWLSKSFLLPCDCGVDSASHHGTSSCAVGWGSALQAGRSRVRFLVVSLEFFTNKILPSALWLWGRLSLASRDKQLRSWLRHWATSRKVSGSISGGVIGIFHWQNPSVRPVTVWSTQPLTEMSTRNISEGLKVPGEYGWQSYHLNVLIVLKSGDLNLLEPSGPIQACTKLALLTSYCWPPFFRQK